MVVPPSPAAGTAGILQLPFPTIIYAARSKWVGELRRWKEQTCVTIGMREECSESQKRKHACLAQQFFHKRNVAKFWHILGSIGITDFDAAC